MGMTPDKLELLAKQCAWDSTPVPCLGGFDEATAEERRSRLYLLGASAVRWNLINNEGVFWRFLRSLDESTLGALAQLLDDERAWLRHEDGAVTILLQDGDVDPERITLEEFRRRFGS
jgi:hypothetical protein